MQMAKNAFLDTCRQDKNHLAYIQSVSDSAEVSKNLTEILVDDRELQRKFQQAILDLSNQRRIVYVLSQIEGWRFRSIPIYGEGDLAECTTGGKKTMCLSYLSIFN
jgi:DNA-directed RNA polymerase specialized sigma24 family protein